MTYAIILSIAAFLVVVFAILGAASDYDDETEALALSIEDYDYACECALNTELADHAFTGGRK